MANAKFFVDQRVKGKTITTTFDSKAAADKFAYAVGGTSRKPFEAQESAFAAKLHGALNARN